MPNLCSKPCTVAHDSVTGMLESNRDVLKFWNQKQTTFGDLHYTCDIVYSCTATHTAKALEQRFGMLTECSYRPGGVIYSTSPITFSLQVVDLLFVLFVFFIVRKILRLQSEAEEMTPDQITTKIKLYEQLGDICAHSEVAFYSAAIHFYSIEVGSYPSVCKPPLYVHVLHG